MMFDTKLCRGCLSSDRKLTPVSAGGLNLYYFLLGEDQRLDALSTAGLDLCWECVATLRRVQIFQARVQQAHTILEDSLGLPIGKSTLSSLTIQQKLEYDDIFKETVPNDHDQPLFSKTKVPNITVDKIVIPTKYKTLVTENAEIFQDESDDDLTKTNYDNDETGNDSGDHESVDACDSRSSSPDITVKKNIPRKKLQEVKIIHLSNLNDEKPKGRDQLQAARVITNRPVKYRKRPAPAIVKTPVIAKLELELQKLMQNAKNSAKNVTQQNTSKQKKTIKESTTSNERNAGSSNENYVIVSDQDDTESSAEEDASNHVRKESKNKCKRSKPDADPDFSLEEDDNGDSDYSKSKEDGENLEDGDKEKIMKEKRFKKTTIMRYKNIDDVLSCFTEVEFNADDLKSILEKQDAIVDEKKPYDCSICGQRFRLRRMLTYHALAYHKATHPAQFRKGSFYSPPPTIPEKPCLWRCSVCTIMLRREHILAHMNAHHRTQYFCNGQGCEWSMKGFWIKEDYIKHWAAIHKQFACDICGKRKTKKSAMELHIMETHLHLPKQQCPHCSRTYVYRKALLQHVINRHSRPEPAERRYCVECDVTFNSVASLQKHVYNRHNAARTKYPCPDCGRVLATRSSYQNHYSLFHTGKTDFCCHECGKYFSKLQALEGHLKTHLNIKAPKNKPCAICGRKFQTNRVLRHHMCTHTGERPHACPHCDAAYAQKYCLRVHLARRHGVLAPAPPGKTAPTAPAPTQDDQ